MNRYERLNQERKMVDMKRKVAAYCRVSTDNEDQANSFESQQRYFKQYIERNPDWELYEVFADEGISGTNTKKRKEFNRMIACAKNGDFDLIITKEISRFARNTLDSIYYTRDLKKHGVGVIFMNDNINTLDGDAELRLAIMSSIAQEESRKTSERVKWGQKRQMEQGVVFGRSMLGYDDLPAMDNDEYRRGKKTTHAVYGEAMGILAGDALLNYAFETAAKAFDMEPDNRNIGKAMQILATKAGIYGMVGGQVVDVQSEDSGDITKEKLDFIYRLKTGALIESSMLIGAVLAGATKNEQNTIGKAATEVGLAFQIQDDILDVTSTLEVLGKPIGSDEKNHKATYVSFEGLEKAKEDVALYTNSAVAGMDSLVVKNEFLNELLLYLISREK